MQPITTTNRLNAAINRLATLEAQLRAEYADNPLWDASWQQAVDKVPAEIAAQCPIPPSEMLGDPDVLIKTAYKSFLRGLELVACKFLADGGTF